MTSPITMSSPLAPVIAEYLALKQALGRRFYGESRTLAHLDRFLATQCPLSTTLTPELFALWCLTLSHLSPTTRRARMRIVRNLCLYIRRTTPANFVPDPLIFPSVQATRRPHIFSEEEIVRLLQAATELPPRPSLPLRAETYRLVIVLLYTAGLRRGELVRLRISDYNPIERTLLIRSSKFHKSRLVALSRDATREVEIYLIARSRHPHNANEPLIVSSCRGLRAWTGGGLGQGMRRLFRSADLRTAAGRLPRVHDLRHTYAVHVLLRWYRAGTNVQARLPALAASMGHVSVVSTAYYLKLLEPVAQAASDRFALHAAPILAHLPVPGGDR